MIEFLTSHKLFCYISGALLVFFLGWLVGKLSGLEKRNKIRKDALKRSKAVIGGQVAEQIAPLLPGFPANPGDCRFVGKPVDFVVFSGMTEHNKIDEILLVEVKTGGSVLTEREKQVKDCISKGRVRYAEYCIQ